MVSSLIFLWTMNSKSCSMILPCGNWVVLNTKFSRNRKKNLFKPSRNWECFSRAFLSAGHFLKSWGNSIFLQPFPGQFLLFSLKVSKHSKQPTCPHGNTIGEKSKRFNQGNIPYKNPIKFWFNAIFEVIYNYFLFGREVILLHTESRVTSVSESRETRCAKVLLLNQKESKCIAFF